MINILSIISSFLFNANFPICNYTANQSSPTVIYSNNQYYCFWTDLRYYGSTGQYAVYGARISNAGTVLDPNGKPMFIRQSAYESRVAFDGTNFLVAFRDSC